eukprot:UN11711
MGIRDWDENDVKKWISKLIEPAAVSQEQLNKIYIKIDSDGIDGSKLVAKSDNLTGLFGDAVADVPPALLTGLAHKIQDKVQEDHDSGNSGAGGNYAPSTDYTLIFREGIKKPVSIVVSADMTLEAAKQLYLAKEGGPTNFKLHDSYKECTLSKTLQKLGLTTDGCSVNIIGRNHGG